MSIHLVRDDLRPPGPPARRHLISIADLTRDDVERLLGTAHVFEGSLTSTNESVSSSISSRPSRPRSPTLKRWFIAASGR